MDAESKIREIVERLADSWNRRDWPAFGRWFTEDADYVTGAGIRLAGRSQILEALSSQAAPSSPGNHLSLVIESLKLIAPDVSMVLCSWRMGAAAGRPGAGDDARAGLLTMVMRDGTDGWRIIALHNTDRTG